MASVRLEHLRKVYDEKVIAVHDATFTIADGEFVVLVGPSGCGKSTTLRMIAGLESITDGALYIDGRQVNHVAPKDRDIAMVFQNYALYPHMTVRENMAFGLKLRKYDKAEINERVNQAADVLGIVPILDRKPRHLSGGQRQRVALGRAIVRKPKVFLFDEPLSNLDAKLRVQMRTEIAKLHHRLASTMVYVTHDQVEAMTMGDRIVVMNEGQIQQIDEPLRLYRQPTNKFVAGFIGSPSMNFIEGRIVKEAGLRFDEHIAGNGEGGLRIDLDASYEAALSGYRDRDITLGIRPEALYIPGVQAPAEAAPPFQVKLEVLEPMGNEIIVYTETAAHRLIARVAPQQLPEPGAMIDIVMDPKRLHFFDRDSGLSLN